ncbi:MAG TPA: DUF2024 family protein [Flavipsychrobacter sp.]|jgi:hypothetical protein|nr:DUF2024 family protein [Flavipsychrobacter sp.]
MNIAVWDTYVKRKNGQVMHFDILVPDEMRDADRIYNYGKDFLASKDEPEAVLDIEECQFCHIEEATEEMKQSIADKGYYTIEMEEIPEQLSPTPSRRELILHLRAHYPQHRFADFKNKTTAEIVELLQQID